MTEQMREELDRLRTENARLIAAAQELVEALRIAEDWSRAVDYASTALAKAGVK